MFISFSGLENPENCLKWTDMQIVITSYFLLENMKHCIREKWLKMNGQYPSEFSVETWKVHKKWNSYKPEKWLKNNETVISDNSYFRITALFLASNAKTSSFFNAFCVATSSAPNHGSTNTWVHHTSLLTKNTYNKHVLTPSWIHHISS